MITRNGSPDDCGIWVFGYGSLVWKPGFEFLDTRVGFVNGWCRRFWQGNDVHRGSPDQLGRVVTLIEEQGAVTFGRAFLIKDVQSARQYLDHRESSLGGYTTLQLDFIPLHGARVPIPVLVYVALPCNPLFLGPAPLESIAHQIVHSEGHSGHNVEYLAKLSAFMTLHVPPQVHYDDHLLALETLVRKYLKSHKPDLMQHFDSALTEVPIFEIEAPYSAAPSHGMQEATTGESFVTAKHGPGAQHKDQEQVFANLPHADDSSTPSPLQSFPQSFINDQLSTLLTESIYFN